MYIIRFQFWILSLFSMNCFCSGDFIFESIQMNNILLSAYYMYLSQMNYLTKSMECKKLFYKNSNVYKNNIRPQILLCAHSYY